MLVEQFLLNQQSVSSGYTPNKYLYAWGDLGTVDVTGLSGGWLDHATRLDNNSWIAVAINTYGINAIRSDGKLFGWGVNGYGYGSNDSTFRSSPVQIGASSWSAISSGISHTVAIRSDGKLFAWGYANNGQLGQGISAVSSPIQIGSSSWVAVSCGEQHTMAIRSGGTLFTWGLGYMGALGIPDSLARQTSPIQIGSSSWTAVSAGISHSMALRSDGALFTWGYAGNTFTLGDNIRIPKSNNSATAFPTTKSWTMISFGQTAAAGIDNNGFLFTWGISASGLLGNGTSQSNPLNGDMPTISPTQIGSSTWTAVQVSASFAVAIRSDGKLFTWGANNFGQLGDGTTVAKSSPVQIGSSSWTAIASQGGIHALAIRSDGLLFAWGLGTSGQLGDGTLVSKSSPVQIGSSSWTAIATNLNNSYAIRSGGTLFSWGGGTNGMLGDGTLTTKSSPVQIGSSSWTAITANDSVSAIRLGGTLFSWGNGGGSSLGDGTTVTKSSPVQIGSSSWTAVTAGQSFKVAIRSNGSLWSWGENTYRQLGDNTTNNRLSPVQIGVAITWTKLPYLAGSLTGAAFQTAGGVLYTWGDDYENLPYNARYLQGKSPWDMSPVQIGSSSWVAIQAMQYGGASIRSGGTLFTWGGGLNGQIGNGTIGSQSAPFQIGFSSWTAIHSKFNASNIVAVAQGGAVHYAGANWLNPGKNNILGPTSLDTTFIPVSPNQFTGNTISFATNSYSRAAAIGGNGSLYFWGYNYLFTNNIVMIPENTIRSPIALLSDAGVSWIAIDSWTSSNPQSVSLGNQRNLAAIRSDGKLFTWGNNTYGQLGDGTTVTKFSPVQIGSSSWTAVSVGEGFMSAIRSGGTLFTWGVSNNFQLGDGTNTAKSSPVQIGSSSWVAVESGWRHSIAIRLGGTLFAWGDNFAGKLGDGTIVTKQSPLQIGSSSWTAISVSSSNSAAIRSDGALFTWGPNNTGQIGDGTLSARSSPVQIGSSSWTAISCGDLHMLGIRSGGTLFAWGQNAYGQLGDSTTGGKSSPVQIGSSSWTAISAGFGSSMGKTTDDKLYAWGLNSFRAVGNDVPGNTVGANRSSPVLVSFNTAQKVDLFVTNGQMAMATGKL